LILENPHETFCYWKWFAKIGVEVSTCGNWTNRFDCGV